MADFSIKAHDRYPSIKATLSSDGQPIDLTGAVGVDFVMRQGGASGALRINDAAQIVDAAGGVVLYDWKPEDTAVAGSYQAEWQITWANGYQQTVPTLTYHSIDILADLDGE